ncbi:hypothetical protein [Streptomyces sp. MJP52]|uniref:hypothetical protein n=1 Tax=Streptomyces sp. MJP52 TaxID=2940555 RepID=UPI0024743CFA|nr:hypothetical protein [Streptomyces sp. MJP52]MDH6226231.1 hypothetical protein [Streptomyces sp. MJP52]
MPKSTSTPTPQPTPAERVAELHAASRADYGTPEQRAARALDAGLQTTLARIHGNEAGGTR